MPIESKITARIAIQMKVGRTPKGRTSHRTTYLRSGVGVDLTGPEVMALVERAAPCLDNPVSKVRYQVLNEGIIWMDDENMQKAERKRLHAEKKAAREAKRKMKEKKRAAQGALVFPEEGAAADTQAAPAVPNGTPVVEHAAALVVSEEKEERKGSFFDAAKHTFAALVNGLAGAEEDAPAAKPKTEAVPEQNTAPAAGVVETEAASAKRERAAPLKEKSPAPASQAPSPPLKIKRTEREIPLYVYGKNKEFDAVVVKLTDSALAGSTVALPYERLLKGGAEARVMQEFGITPEHPLTVRKPSLKEIAAMRNQRQQAQRQK